MAGTETIIEEPRTVRETLRAYDVLETGVETSSVPSQNASQQPVRSERNWPSDWRRMPAYHETSRTHRISDRSAGQDLVESGIVVAMFSGVWMMGTLNRIWRATGGKLNGQIMRYPVGGDW